LGVDFFVKMTIPSTGRKLLKRESRGRRSVNLNKWSFGAKTLSRILNTPRTTILSRVDADTFSIKPDYFEWVDGKEDGAPRWAALSVAKHLIENPDEFCVTDTDFLDFVSLVRANMRSRGGG
jgi:hypothetical protein